MALFGGKKKPESEPLENSNPFNPYEAEMRKLGYELLSSNGNYGATRHCARRWIEGEGVDGNGAPVSGNFEYLFSVKQFIQKLVTERARDKKSLAEITRDYQIIHAALMGEKRRRAHDH